ncbi:unnamed protein product [Schistosoma mattheei]|uniref:Uncharacterized protein n=1 Tax=Schistosoma mattheei TaxID=31246 RepID=A0A3P8E077_9TREM|nr:unnamed protein product [Schistosoma mattheei]
MRPQFVEVKLEEQHLQQTLFHNGFQWYLDCNPQ